MPKFVPNQTFPCQRLPLPRMVRLLLGCALGLFGLGMTLFILWALGCVGAACLQFVSHN